MDLGLKGAKAVVSGGSQGIGLAVAKALIAEGAEVQIAARSEDTLETAVTELSALGEDLPIQSVDAAQVLAMEIIRVATNRKQLATLRDV